MSEGRSIPCFGGWLKVLCISPRMVMSCITQWSFQCVAFFKRSTSSFNLSRSTISDFLRMALFFLLWFGLLGDTLLGSAFVSVFSKVDGNIGIGLAWRCERCSRSCRIEGMGKQVWNLIPHWRKSLEEWNLRHGRPYCMEITHWCGGIGVSCMRLSRLPLIVHVKQ